ncbi:MAG: putative Fatty acid hydroxylase [Nitrospira sp.]
MIVDGLRWFLERTVETAFSSFRSRESFAEALGHVPTVFVNFSNGLAWPYLLSSVLLAWVIYVFARRSRTTTVASFLEFAFPSRLYRHPSTALDFRFMAVDVFVTMLLYAPMFTGVGLLGTKIISAVLVDRLGWDPPRALSVAALVLAAVGFLLLSDCVNYWSHVWFHRSPLLWSFHRVHHSAEVLTPAAAYRVHPVENAVVVMLQAPIVGLSAVFYQNILGPDRQITMIFGVSVIGFILALMGTHLRHSHIWFSYGPWLNRVVMSPAHHQIHHSIESRHWNKNFGVKFTIWDQLFGTLYAPEKPEALKVGLPDAGPPEFTSVPRLYFLPFTRVIHMLSLLLHVERSR